MLDTMAPVAPPVVLTQEMIENLPEQPLGDLPGVRRRVLWQDGESEAGVLEIEPGQHLGTHAHRSNHHHFWVLSGRAVVLGHELTPGSYVHIPHGIDHDIDATLTEGCSVFYLYLRTAP
jgi:quercetin dioxygenase-like cupin family protein